MPKQMLFYKLTEDRGKDVLDLLTGTGDIYRLLGERT